MPPLARAVAVGFLMMSAACRPASSDCGPVPSLAGGATALADGLINLSDGLAAGHLRAVNRGVTPLAGGNGIRVTAAPGIGVIWINDAELGDGTIEADVCGRDVTQESFLGIAFHRQNDEKYEAVYLRPFNFRASAADRRQHAIQYVAMPENDYARLRARFPGQFEGAVASSTQPAAWNHVRLVVRDGRVQAFVGTGGTAALDVRELQAGRHGQAGLFVDNGSDGAFANLRILRGAQ
jgi:hypothetical protein